MDSRLGAELLKTRKRWMPYALFALMTIGTGMIIFLGGYVEWKTTDDAVYRQEALRTFSYPYSIPALIDNGQFWGAMFAGILAASVVATEYNWGTIRQVLIRGQGRSSFLANKLLAIMLIATAIMLAALAVGIALSVYLTTLADISLTREVPGDPNILDFLMMVLRGAWCIVPYGMFAFMLAVITRSSTLSITGSILYVFGEALLVALVSSLGDAGSFVEDISVGENVTAVMAENRIGEGRFLSSALREQEFDGLNNPNIAALIIGAHIAAYTIVSFAVFTRRDVKV